MSFLYIYPLNVFEANDIKFTTYSTENGLSQSSVKSIIQDRKGYLWVGTMGGLQRYNGNTFEIMESAKENGGLYHSFVRKLFEDSQGNIWILTKSGISYFNYKNNVIQKYAPISARSIIEVDGTIYVGSDNGLYSIQLKTFEIKKESNAKIDEHVVYSLGFFYGKIIVGTDSGLLIYDKESKIIKEVSINEKILNIAYSKDLYILTNDNVYKMDESFNKSLVYSENNGVFSDMNIHNNKLYIGYRNGLLVLNENGNDGTAYKHIPSDKYSLPNSYVLSLFRDNSDVLWIGTSTGGLSKENKIKYLRNFDGNNKYGIPNNNVHTIFLDKLNRIWVGHDEGFSIYNRETKKAKNFLSNEEIWAITEYNNEFYIGSKSGKLYVYDINGNLKNEFKLNEKIKDIKGINTIYCESGFILVGTYGNGLIKIDRKNFSFSIFNVENKNFSNNFIWDIEKTGLNEFYIGTEDNGIVVFNPKTGNYRVVNKDNSPLKENVAWQLKKYKDYMIIGTWDSGLYLYNVNSKKYLHYDTNNGLPDNTIYSIQVYNDKIWVSTDNGIAELSLKNNSVNVYDVNDGLQDNEFNIGASYLNETDNEIFFGGIKGSSALPISKDLKHSKFYVYLEKIMIDFKEYSIKDEEVKMTYRNSYISFNLSVLDFLNNNKNIVKYKLVGFDNEWNQTKEKTIQYTNLKSGNYVFTAYGINSEGDKSSNSIEIKVHISSNPLWNIYSILLYILILIGVIYFILKSHFNSKILHEKLKYEEMEKESAIEAKEIKETFLSNMSHEIRTPLFSIITAIESIRTLELKDEKLNKYIDVIWRSSDILFGIVNNILDISRLDKIGLNKKSFDLKKLFDDFAVSYEEQAKRKKLFFISHYINNSKYNFIYSDQIKIEQVIGNLLSNAVKYSFDGTIEFIMEIVSKGDKSILNILIKDQGIGIKESMHSKVFDRYERVEEDTEKILGTGLGLTLVKSLVEKLGGSVSLKSNEGKGTSFYVTIPVEIKEEKNEIIKETNYREKLVGNVLLVEDNELVHEMTKDMLEKIGFTIFSAKKLKMQ